MKLDFTHDALDAIKGINEPKRFKQVLGKILDLLKGPHPNDSEQLKGYDARRVDIGEYRIIYRVNEKDDFLQVIIVGKRNDSEVYKELKR